MSTTSSLKDLSELLTDSQLGFGEAADRLNDQRLKNMMMKFGNGRAPMIEEIGNELARSGEGTPDEGTTKGSLHRKWIEIRDNIARSDDKNVLTECERGEEHLLERYDSVIDDDQIPHHIRDMLKEHRVMINSDLSEIRSLKNTIEHEG